MEKLEQSYSVRVAFGTHANDAVLVHEKWHLRTNICFRLHVFVIFFPTMVNVIPPRRPVRSFSPTINSGGLYRTPYFSLRIPYGSVNLLSFYCLFSVFLLNLLDTPFKLIWRKLRRRHVIYAGTKHPFSTKNVSITHSSQISKQKTEALQQSRLIMCRPL